jgi:hypothetical protein
MNEPVKNIYDYLAEEHGFPRQEVKLTIIGAPYGLPLAEGNRRKIWESFCELISEQPTLLKNKGWIE